MPLRKYMPLNCFFILLSSLGIVSCANANRILEESKVAAQKNAAIVGATPSPSLSSQCDKHYLENNVGEKIRTSYKRATQYKTHNPWVTPQNLAHKGSPELGKKLIGYYAKYEGTNALGLPSTHTAVCFFRVENGAAQFETSCEFEKCPYLFYLPLGDIEATDILF